MLEWLIPILCGGIIYWVLQRPKPLRFAVGIGSVFFFILLSYSLMQYYASTQNAPEAIKWGSILVACFIVIFLFAVFGLWNRARRWFR